MTATKINRGVMKEKLSTEQKKFKLIEGPIARQLVIFALPLFLANILQQMFNTADAIIAGRFMNPEAMTAIVEAGKVVNVLINLFLGISVGAGIVISQYFGAKDKDNLSKAVHSSVVMGVIFGVFMTAIGLLTSGILLRAMRIDAEHLALAGEYLRIYFVGVLFVFLYNIGAGILRAVGDSVTPLIFLGIAVALNFVLDYLFVAKFNMGVAGTAWATVITNALASILVLGRLFMVKTDYRLSFKKMKIDPKISMKIIKVGFPIGIQNSLISVAHIVMQRYISSFGKAAEQGAALCSKIDGYLYVPVNSLTMSLATFVGQNLGAGKKDRVKKAVKVNILLCEGISVALGLLLFFLHKPIMLFISPGVSADALKVASLEMVVIIFSYPILALNDNFANSLRGAGQSLIPSIILIIGMFGIRIGFMEVCLKLIGWNNVIVVFLTFPVSWTFTCVCLGVCYYRGKWLNKKLVVTVSSPVEQPVFCAEQTHPLAEQPCMSAAEMPFKAEPLPIFNDKQ